MLRTIVAPTQKDFCLSTYVEKKFLTPQQLHSLVPQQSMVLENFYIFHLITDEPGHLDIHRALTLTQTEMLTLVYHRDNFKNSQPKEGFDFHSWLLEKTSQSFVNKFSHFRRSERPQVSVAHEKNRASYFCGL